MGVCTQLCTVAEIGGLEYSKENPCAYQGEVCKEKRVFSKVNLDAKIAYQGWATSGPDYRYSMCAIDFLSSDFRFVISYWFSQFQGNFFIFVILWFKLSRSKRFDVLDQLTSRKELMPSQFPTWFTIVWSKVTFIGAYFLILPNFSSLVLAWSRI